ncbi:Reverse transcriptase (RNA-dependent DNA polymerase) [Popillia japonica]|uniref:Reverse transcriptase (RNA-dependent DNA polymerase) n=1 Tax=Popillia japonica TaxID=7064 RepID=A0AAW1KNA4_POPJA
MTNKTSAGDDEISSFLLKNIIYELAEHLAYLINNSFVEGRFPDSWKTATVVPIYKRGSQIDVASYRPISILSTFSKALERAAYNQLMGYLSNHNLICNNQHGFRQQRLTETALIDSTQYVYYNMDLVRSCYWRLIEP